MLRNLFHWSIRLKKKRKDAHLFVSVCMRALMCLCTYICVGLCLFGCACLCLCVCMHVHVFLSVWSVCATGRRGVRCSEAQWAMDHRSHDASRHITHGNDQTASETNTPSALKPMPSRLQMDIFSLCPSISLYPFLSLYPSLSLFSLCLSLSFPLSLSLPFSPSIPLPPFILLYLSLSLPAASQSQVPDGHCAGNAAPAHPVGD